MTAHDTKTDSRNNFRNGVLLVVGATLAWSLGGVLSRFLLIEDTWTVVFWRSLYAAIFLLGFLLWRDGPAGARALILGMRWPSIIVGCCYAISTISFILALAETTVAKILLIQSSVPIIAAAFSWVMLREKLAWHTLAAILAVVVGIGTIVSSSLGQGGSIKGDLLSLAIAISFSLSVVMTRKHPEVRMTPAVLLSVCIAGATGLLMSSDLSVSGRDMAILVPFGMVNLGLGMALFVTGARLIPSVLSALLSVIEPILGPIWVWLVHGEDPGARTLVGGSVVIAALIFNIVMDAARPASRPVPPQAKAPHG